MATTIQISDSVKQLLDRMKLMKRETYNDVIEVLIEDNLELSEDTKRDIGIARKQIKERKVLTQEEVEKRLGL